MIFMDVEEYSTTCPWMNEFFEWKNGWNLFWMLPTNVIFLKNWTKQEGQTSTFYHVHKKFRHTKKSKLIFFPFLVWSIKCFVYMYCFFLV
jgi:hypothetical protein